MAGIAQTLLLDHMSKLMMDGVRYEFGSRKGNEKVPSCAAVRLVVPRELHTATFQSLLSFSTISCKRVECITNSTMRLKGVWHVAERFVGGSHRLQVARNLTACKPPARPDQQLALACSYSLRALCEESASESTEPLVCMQDFGVRIADISVREHVQKFRCKPLSAGADCGDSIIMDMWHARVVAVLLSPLARLLPCVRLLSANSSHLVLFSTLEPSWQCLLCWMLLSGSLRY